MRVQWAAGPGQPDTQCFPLQSFTPLLYLGGVRTNVGDLGGNGVQFRADGQGQTEQRALPVDRRKRLIAADDLRRSRGMSQQAEQTGLDFQDHFSSPRGDQGDIADELECVTHALLGVKQNSRPLQGFTFPERLGKFPAKTKTVLRTPAVLILAQAQTEIALLQMNKAKEGAGLGGVRLQF